MDKQYKSSVTIGIPVHNEEKFIAKTVLSAVNQSDNIIITDNASTDSTSKICKELSDKYSNITYIKHETNLGCHKNFYSSLNLSKTRYFMWLGAHDMISETYVESLINILNQQRDIVSAFAPTKYIDENDYLLYYYDYWYNSELISDDPFKRIYSLTRYIYDCSFIHSIFRTDILKHSWPKKAYLGYDIVILAKAISLGPMAYCPSENFIRRMVRNESHAESLERQHNVITGSSNSTIDADPFYEVKIGVNEAINTLPTKNFIRKMYWKKKVNNILNQRFKHTNE